MRNHIATRAAKSAIAAVIAAVCFGSVAAPCFAATSAPAVASAATPTTQPTPDCCPWP